MKALNVLIKILRGEWTVALFVNRLTRLFEVDLPPNIAGKIAKREHNNEADLRSKGIKYIHINTYDGYNQAVHPDVTIANCYGKRCYIMTVTPHPFGDSRYENPSIYYSFDGEKWIDFPVGRNPIARAKKCKYNYLSDAEIFFCGGLSPQLWVYYRESDFGRDINYDIIYRKKTNFQTGWSKEEILCETSECGVISPSIIRTNKLFYIFFVRKTGTDETELIKMCTQNGDFNGEGHSVIIKNEPIGKKIWHIDVKEGKNCLHAMITYAKGIGGAESRLYYAKSFDYGEIFEIVQEVMMDCIGKNFKSIYRSCLVNDIYDEDVLHLYISAQTKRLNWHIFLQKGFLHE